MDRATPTRSSSGASDPQPGEGPPRPTRIEGSRLLVVDDNEMNRDLLSRRLARRGFEVEVAEDGHAALAMLAAEKYDLVLLDIMMPEISGLEVLAEVRKSRSMAELPIIMATAKRESEDIVEALKLGANDYVTKPLDFPVVLARTRTQLTLKRMAEQLELRNQFIRSIFGRYISDEVVESLLEEPAGLELGGEKRRITVMMTDLRGFTSMSERIPPEQVVQVLNHYLGRMTEIIMECGGTIDEFIGDAILVLFGAPVYRSDHAARAIACAVRMQQAMEAVNRHNRERGFPQLQMGIGLNTGGVVVGNIGSERRAKYGVIGRHVNLAARIESYTVGGQILVAESTLREAGDAVRVDGRLEVHPKGVDQPVWIYEVGGIGGDYDLHLRPTEEALVELPATEEISMVVIDGKDAGGPSRRVLLLRLSGAEAEIEVDEALAPLTDIKLALPGLGAGSAVYAKVLGREGLGCRAVVRFTSVPPPAEAWIRKRVDGGS